jgi:hypothetical protein
MITRAVGKIRFDAIQASTSGITSSHKSFGVLSHVRQSERGELLPAMVDISSKSISARTARAECHVLLPPAAWKVIKGQGEARLPDATMSKAQVSWAGCADRGGSSLEIIKSVR